MQRTLVSAAGPWPTWAGAGHARRARYVRGVANESVRLASKAAPRELSALVRRLRRRPVESGSGALRGPPRRLDLVKAEGHPPAARARRAREARARRRSLHR